MILRLPRLTSGAGSWTLPLAEHVAVRLIEVLLLDDKSDRHERLLRIMGDDPSLTLWAVCRWGATAPASVADVADWFDEHVLSVLHWSADDCCEPFDSNSIRLSAWSDLSAAGVAVSRIAQLRATPGANASRAHLVGLLHGAVRWLQASGSRIRLADCQASKTCLPHWLVMDLGELAAGTLGRSSLAAVAAAMYEYMECDEGPESEPTHTQRRGEAISQLAYAARLRELWQSPRHSRPSAARYLPQLISKLARLRDLETQFANALEREKLAALKELAYGASHELNNPLANISTRAQTLLREETDPERRRKLATINTQAFRAHEMISDMMLFAKPPRLELADLDVVALLKHIVRELLDKAQSQGTELRHSAPDESLWIQADEGQLAVALRALCLNSLEALESGGEIELTAELAELASPDSRAAALIRIRDSGPGITPEVRRHLFDPFYSGREAGRGLGLGLSKAWRIVDEHGGRIGVSSEPGQGATFSIWLPARGIPSGGNPQRRLAAGV